MAYDAIIIGAGHNGLAAAIHLARKGWRVGVFEKNSEAGGAVRTREVTLPGFRHDLFAANLNLFAGSPFFQAYRDDLLRHGLGFVPTEHCFASAFPDDRWFGVGKDLEATVQRLESFSRKDAETWRTLLASFGSDAPHIFGLMGNPIPSWASAGVIYRAWRAKGLPWLLDTAKLLASSPRAWLDRNFESEHVKATLAAWGMHLDFSPDIAGGALFPYLEGLANQRFGMVIGRGGGDTVIKAMTAYLRELGGEIHLNSEVRRVEAVGGRASGIELADGRKFTAGKAVIANLAPQILFGKLLPDGAAPKAVTERMRKYRNGPGTMMVHLAVDAMPNWRAGEELKRFAYVHLAASMDAMARVYQEAIAGMIPAEPVVVVGQPTAIDPSRAPDGKHILWLQVRTLPSHPRGDAKGEITGNDWDQIKDAVADRVIAIVERYAPGLRSQILGRAVFSPLDLERENANLIGGDSLNGSHHLDQNFIFRPVPGWSRYRMPVKDLWLVGAATWPGAGVGAGSGFMAAKMLAGT
jgi:phytoene dehydrogenase-like protein